LEFDFSKVAVSSESKQNIERRLTPRKRFNFYLSLGNNLNKSFCLYSLISYKKINLNYPFLGALGLLSFLLADYQAVPDGIYEMLYARLLSLTAICFSALILAQEIDPKQVLKQHHKAQISMCANALIVHVSLLLVGHTAAIYGNFHYQTGSILVIIFFCSVIRVHFLYVLPTVFLILVSQLYFIKNIIHASEAIFLEHLFIFSAVAVFGCLANARMEYEIRKNFLQSLLLELKRQKLEQAKEKLFQLSISDPLTGLTNRRGFDQNLKRIWSTATRNQHSVTLLMIDIDLFKQFNDSQGHPEGDIALRNIAGVFQQTLKRPGDVAARMGGEEFAIVLPQTDHQSGLLVAETIRKAIWEKNITHPLSHFDKRMTISIGVATTTPQPNSTYEPLIQQADIALYKAKEAGRNQVQSA